MTHPLTPRTAIGFLRSCALSGETLSEEDLASVDKALEQLENFEDLTRRLAERLRETEHDAHRAGARGSEACPRCEGTGKSHDNECPVLSRTKINEDLLAEYQQIFVDRQKVISAYIKTPEGISKLSGRG